MATIRKCSECFRDQRIVARDLCSACYSRWHRSLAPLADNDRKRAKNGEGNLNHGYRTMHRPDHPFATKNGKVLQHRLVMEATLGRYLAPDENVHHINGVRSDNRPENLELWLISQPPGQRVEDLVEWARSILERYSA